MTIATIIKAAPNPDVTILPLGSTKIEQGSKLRSFRLPSDQLGPIQQPMVFLAAQPFIEENAPTPIKPEDQPEGGTVRKQVAATLTFSIGDRKLPPWTLKPEAGFYVINLESLRKSPAFATSSLMLKVELESRAPEVSLFAFGMPDPRLVNDSLDGPWDSFISAAGDGDVKAYLTAVAKHYAGSKDAALQEFNRLTGSSNAAVARLAGRGKRLLGYELRTHKLSGNFQEHYRWALYLEQCGLIEHAFTELDDTRVLAPERLDFHVRAGEAADRITALGTTVFSHFFRAGQLARSGEPLDWYVLMPVLMERPGKRLSNNEIVGIKNQFLFMQGMVWGATRGLVRVLPTFINVADEKDWAYRFWDDRVLGPSEAMIAERGWFDSVFSIIPRTENDHDLKPATVLPDRGPMGVAISSFPHDATWFDMIKAFYEHFTWAAEAGEIGTCIPDADSALFCGRFPAPHRGFAYRAALAEGFTPAMYHRVKISDPPLPGSYLRLWSVEGPCPVKDQPPTSGRPARHVLDAWPNAAGNKQSITSEQDFIDLARIFPDAGWSRARATCWVFSPDDREARMWIGQNDGAAVWVNRRCVHEGRYYSSGNFEDKNLIDTVASYAPLRQGWNEISVIVESWPAPFNKGWGFSLRLCDWENQTIPGLAYAYDRPDEGLVEPPPAPSVGPYYSWNDVKNNYLEQLPKLTDAGLAQITGLKDVALSCDIRGRDGFWAIQSSQLKESKTYRTWNSTWQHGKDSDFVLNNLMDWSREGCAALHYRGKGGERDLLFVKPQYIENFLALLIEPESAMQQFAGRAPIDRLLGYVTAKSDRGLCIPLIVVDTVLADGKTWPRDEEDLLNPIPPKYVPNPGLVTSKGVQLSPPAP